MRDCITRYKMGQNRTEFYSFTQIDFQRAKG